MSNPDKKVIFEISGGIGNQLFQFSAAKHFEFQNDLKGSQIYARRVIE